MEPLFVYFSSVTENTRIFVEKLPYESKRIPLLRNDGELFVKQPFVLVTPTYGGGHEQATVPKQVLKFFQHFEHRKLCVGVIGSGNMNFGDHYCKAADMLAEKLKVPVLARFELRGLSSDVKSITEGIENHWHELLSLRGLGES